MTTTTTTTTNQKLNIYPDPDMPGNGYKTTLPDNSILYFESREKAEKFAEIYAEALTINPPKGARLPRP